MVEDEKLDVQISSSFFVLLWADSDNTNQHSPKGSFLVTRKPGYQNPAMSFAAEVSR
jgi:hypothetical protein